MCHKYPKIVEALDHRHEMYAQQQAFLYQLEKAGKAFIFAPSFHLPTATTDLSIRHNDHLYNLGLYDYEKQRKALYEFMAR